MNDFFLINKPIIEPEEKMVKIALTRQKNIFRQRYSDYMHLLCITTYCIRFIRN